MIRMMDPDSREGAVHGPLRGGCGSAHLGLEALQQGRDVEALGVLRDAHSGQVPSAARRHGVGGAHPALAQRLLVRVVRDDVRVAPVCYLIELDRAHQGVEFVCRERLGLHHEDREKTRIDVARFPELEAELVVGLDLLGQLADVTELDAILVVAGAVLGIAGADLVVAEGFEPGQGPLAFHGHDPTT